MKMLKTVDRLSELPESLIFEILSFLEMRDIVRTTLVSKRWQDLWITIPYLYFNESKKNSVQTRNFIYEVLRPWKGTKILKFKIRFGEVYDASLSGDVEFWVGFATERKVEELYLHLPYDYQNPILMDIDRGNGNLQWDGLKSLLIHGFCTREDFFDQLVSSTPQLEILDAFLDESPQKLSIRSSSLKMLTLSILSY